MVEGTTEYVTALRGLPFVDAVHVDAPPAGRDEGFDAVFRIRAKGSDYLRLSTAYQSEFSDLPTDARCQVADVG